MAEEKISLPEPKPPTIIKYSDAENLIQGATDAEVLAFTMLSEAKGTGDDSLSAIGHTILNRKESDLYNFSQQDSIKDVVRQKTSSGDYEYNGLENEIKKGEKVYTPFENTREYIINNPKEYKKVLEIAKNLISMSPENREEADPTMGATFFQNPKTRTNTFIDQKANTGEFIKTKSLGGHDFYSAPFGGPPPPLPSVIPESPPKGRKTKFNDPDKNFAEQMSSAQALSEIRNVTETPTTKSIDLSKKTEKEGIMDMLFGLFGGEKEPVKESPVVEDPAAEGLKLLGGHRQRTLSTSNIGMARGGMVKQMSMFDEGGLLDQGGETDPVSGNDVPPGSLKEEVRDDIPAQLSEGEFVFPADVVRYIGLEKLMQMRQEAKMGLKRMEEMGQMGNSDEATMPDDLPFTLDDLDVDDEPQMFQAGGVVQPAGFTGITDLQASQFAPAPQQFQQFGYTPPPPPPTPQAYVPTQQATIPTMEVPSELPTFEQLIPAPEGRYDELIEFENKETGQRMSIPFVDGQPIYPIPNGFTRVPTDIIKPEVPETVVPTARVESAVDDDDDEAQRRREAEEEAMYGPGGGRVALGGELYTGPTKFVGDNIKTRLISGTVRGSTKVGVSFNVPGSKGLGSAIGLAGGLAFGKGIPENATATFFLNGATYTVNSETYNKMKENQFRGDESNSILAKLNDARAIMTEKKVSAKDAETILDIREKLESSKAEQEREFLEAFEAGEKRREAERRLKEMQEREEERKRQLEAERRRAEQETKDMSYQEQQQYREERESEREEQIKDSSGGRQEQDRIDNIRDDSDRQREQERFDSGARQEAERQTYEETGIGGSDYAKMYGNKGGLASKPKPKVKKMKRGGLASKK